MKTCRTQLNFKHKVCKTTKLQKLQTYVESNTYIYAKLVKEHQENFKKIFVARIT